MPNATHAALPDAHQTHQEGPGGLLAQLAALSRHEAQDDPLTQAFQNPRKIAVTLMHIRARVEKLNGHVVWQGSLANDRPAITLYGKRVYVTRFLWALTHPEFPLSRGFRLNKRCDIDGCILLEHHAPSRRWTRAARQATTLADGRGGPRPGAGRPRKNPELNTSQISTIPRTQAGRPRTTRCIYGHPKTFLASGKSSCHTCDNRRKQAAYRTSHA